ncbi:tetraacyldisaccharide 4'-kinase [bacterium]|nr:tetraacyldisaccharide 4'-kinase [bacterium]
MNLFLKILSPIYAAGITVRNFAYDHSLFESEIAPVPVVSIGNLTAGGSGKSPFTLEVATQLQQLAPRLRFAIVSRGYGRHGRGLRVVADDRGLLLSADIGGDEPVMLARNLPGIPMVVSEKRILGVIEAVKRFNSEVILLDDAFQHRAISRTLDIVLMDETIPAWQYKLLPEGRLREFPSSLKRAHLIVLTGGGSHRRKGEMKRWLSKFSSVPIISGHLAPVLLQNIDGSETFGISHLDGKNCYAVAGIARPQRFMNTLSQININVAGYRFLNDHSKFTAENMRQIIQDAKREKAEVILMTEKDSVKWKNTQSDIPVYFLKMGWQWELGEEILQGTLRKILERRENVNLAFQGHED